MTSIVGGLSSLGNRFVSMGEGSPLGLGTVIQTAKGCVVKAAIGSVFALAVGANLKGSAAAAVGYVLTKRAIVLVDLGIFSIKKRVFDDKNSWEKGAFEVVLTVVVGYALKVFTGRAVGVPLFVTAINLNECLIELIKKHSHPVFIHLNARFFFKAAFRSIIPGTAAYLVYSGITALAALKIGQSNSLVASMPVSFAFSATMVVTTVIGTTLARDSYYVAKKALDKAKQSSSEKQQAQLNNASRAWVFLYKNC